MLTESELLDYLQEPLENHVGYQLRRLAMQIQVDLTTEFKALELIPSTASILLILSSQKDVIQMDLSHLLGIKRTNISPMVVSLEKRGLVSRSSLDGRSQYVELTEQGNELISEILFCLEKHTKKCFSLLSNKEISVLTKAFSHTQNLLDPKVVSSEKVTSYQHLSFLIIRTSSLAMSKLVKDLSILDLIPTNASAMMMLFNNPGINQSNLSRHLGIKRTNISTIISELKARQLVETELKGRTQELCLSITGGALVKDIAQILEQHETYCFGHINKPEEVISSLLAIREQLTKK